MLEASLPVGRPAERPLRAQKAPDNPPVGVAAKCSLTNPYNINVAINIDQGKSSTRMIVPLCKPVRI
jgi:hypothetical protein